MSPGSRMKLDRERKVSSLLSTFRFLTRLSHLMVPREDLGAPVHAVAVVGVEKMWSS